MSSNAKYNNLLILVALLQITFWYFTEEIRPDMPVVENPPSLAAAKVFSLGDEEFYFRVLAMELQNAGDTYGRFTPLKLYDYDLIQKWLFLLDELDSKSNFTPSIAAYYYGLTQYTPDTRYIIEYLEKHYDSNPAQKWWWLSQAIYLANHRLEDKTLALHLAYKLAASPAENMPIWARQMPAFIHEQMGEEQQAFYIIKNILDNYQELSPQEINFMTYFISERLDKFIKDNDIKVDKKYYDSRAVVNGSNAK